MRLSVRNVGFTMREHMVGSHRFEDGQGSMERHPFSFTVTWGPPDILRWLDFRGHEFMTQPMEGVITAGGLCRNAPCRGTLSLDYFTGRRIRYDLGFQADGLAYRFAGEKVEIRVWNLPVSHTTCFGWVTEEPTGRLVSTALVRFPLRSLPRFMASFRLVARERTGGRAG